MLQRSPEWYEARLGKATASRFADILAKTRTGEGAGRKNYRAELVIERLTGLPTDTYTNGYMQWGTDYEDMAVLEYELSTGNNTDECGFIDHANLKAGASPDRLVGSDGLLEAKAPNSATHIETLKFGVVPGKYIPQIQGQLWITGRKWCDFVSYDPRMPSGLRLFIKRVERDDEYVALLETEVTKFLDEVKEEVEILTNK